MENGYVGMDQLTAVPDVYSLNNVQGFEPQRVRFNPPLSSPAMNDLWLKFARRAKAFPDFKLLSDLQRRPLNREQRRRQIQEGKRLRRSIFDRLLARGSTGKKAARLAQRAYARWVINQLYHLDGELHDLPQEVLAPRITVRDERYRAALEHVETTWAKLTWLSRPFSEGSLLPSPYPVVVSGGRFREAYYWDSYFGAFGLILSGRIDLAAAQLENLLHLLQVFGKIPNGFRDYYLTRSQPPVISLFAFLIHQYRPNREWLLRRVYPLLEYDYKEFWMKQRFDQETGLNFYSDDLDLRRPERHSYDNEEKLGETHRDVRAQCESGLDHTEALPGIHTASVSLNAFLYRYEKDLSALAAMAGENEQAKAYQEAADRRQVAIHKYLWDESTRSFRNYDLRDKKSSAVCHGDQFAMLYVGAASEEQARALASHVLSVLERPGGLAASDRKSGKQWDGDNGWAPLNMMAIQGLADYGHIDEAWRLASKWLHSLTHVYQATGSFYEKIDVTTELPPRDKPTQYPNQIGFLWTNSSYIWVLNFLKIPIIQNPAETSAIDLHRA